MTPVPTLLLLSALVAGAEPLPAQAVSVTTGGDPCTLVEGLAGQTAPVRSARSVRGAFKALDRAGSSAAKLGKAHDQLATVLGAMLKASQTVFHPAGVPFRDWEAKHRKKARAFLERHVRGRGAVLRVGVGGFEPQPPVRAALQWAACRSARLDLAIAYGRRASADDESAARAFAALLLLVTDRRGEAAELAPRLKGEGFLVSWVLAELAAEPDERRRRHAEAGRRVITPAQHAAWQDQADRLGLGTP